MPVLRNITILVAEDNQMNQQLIRHVMRQWKFDYLLVNNGQEAVEALKQKTYSIILMDIQMPEMDGYEATTAIREELKLNIPIIAMTAHAMPGEKERCLSYGMNDYISKPVKDIELYNILQKHTTGAENGSQNNKSIVDLAYLKDISMGDGEFEKTIIRQFIIQVPEELSLMQEAIHNRKLIQIKGIAHSMKSSIAYLGLTEHLYPFLHRIETEASSNEKQPHYEEDFSEIKSVCELAIHEARELVNSSLNV